jgi:5-methylcytosine-specific restriction enzyme A
MAKEYAKRFYNSKAWKLCRESYITKVFGMCEHCGSPGYILDHIEEITLSNINDPNITLNHDNLQYLCLPCHNKKTFAKYRVTREDVMFDEEGNLVHTPPINF